MAVQKSWKTRIERAFDGRPALASVETVAAFAGLRNLRLDEIRKLNSFKRNLFGIRTRLGYQTNFLNLDLRKAYPYRIELLAAVWKGIFPGNPEDARRYLSILAEEDFFEAIPLNEVLRNLMKEARKGTNEREPLLDTDRLSLGRVLMCGPSADPSKMDFDSPDAIVFNKPLPDNIKVDPSKIILILNNQWPMERGDELLIWLEKQPGSRVLSPQYVGDSISPHTSFGAVPRFQFKIGLMGLQRSLVVLKQTFDIGRLEIQGYDFSLSHNAYASWYPSLIRKNYGNQKKGIVISSMYHDLLLNILFVRRFCAENPWVEGLAPEIAKKQVSQLVDTFETTYGKTALF